MKIKFKAKFLRGPHAQHEVLGFKEIDTEDLAVGDVQDIPKTEALLEKLLGFRVHIEQVHP